MSETTRLKLGVLETILRKPHDDPPSSDSPYRACHDYRAFLVMNSINHGAESVRAWTMMRMAACAGYVPFTFEDMRFNTEAANDEPKTIRDFGAQIALFPGSDHEALARRYSLTAEYPANAADSVITKEVWRTLEEVAYSDSYYTPFIAIVAREHAECKCE